MERKNINFKKVSEEAYKDVAFYIDALIPYITYLGDLYFADLDGHHFLITQEGNKFIIVENYRKELNTYCLEFDDMGKLVKYSNDLCEYELSFEDEDVLGIRSVDKLSQIVEQLVYFPSEENDPSVNIDYYQYFPDATSSVVYNYDITNRDASLEMAFSYIGYHFPKKIVLSQSEYFFNVLSHKKEQKEQIFFEDLKGDKYCRAIFKFRDMLVPEFNKRYPKDRVMYALEDLGYKIKIPSKMSDIICGKNDELKRLQLLTQEFKNDQEDKKIQ